MSQPALETNEYYIDTENYSQTVIKTKTYSKNGIDYKILNYDKNILCNDDMNSKLYRSIIVSSPDNKILTFSPSKSTDIDIFKAKYSELNDNIFVNEMIEGTMINLFYDNRTNQWDIATRGAVGGSYFYYRNQYEEDPDKTKKQPSFYQMFLDGLRCVEGQKLNELSLLEYLPKTYSYSFVLQHPDNHIVLKITEPKVYLVAVYELKNNNTVKYIKPTEYESWRIFQYINGVIHFPISYTFKTYDDITNEFTSIQTDYNKLGVMLTNMENGERSAIKNPTYDSIKTLRGNNPNLQYQYLCLRRMGKVKDFLYYFPQYKHVFFNFRQEYNDFISNVHTSYVTYYVQKQNVKISKKYFTHIYKIHHELYLPSLQTDEPLIIRIRVIKDYFEKMEPRELIYHLHYDRRMNQ